MIYAAQAAVRHGNGGLSASIRHQNGQGLALAAEEQVKLHRTADARALAQDAIRHAPLSVVALRVLATVDDLDRRAGMAAWRVASATGWRDAPTQFWAMQQALVNKEYGTAAVRADAMLRTSTEGVRDRIGLVRAIAADPRFRRELLGRLLLTPPWQDAFFEIPANASDQQVQGAFWTLRDLVRLHHSIDPVQSRSLIAALIARKQYAQAIQIRRAISGPNSVAIGSADLSFDQSNQYYIGQATQFEWNFNKAGRAIASVEQSGTRRVMVLETDGRDAYQPVRRFVALEPGPYRLGYAMHGAPAAPRTFGITVSCADSAQPLGSSPTTDLPRGDFVERAFDFVVPPSCPLQLLAFRSEATGGVAQAEFTRLWLRRR